MDKIIVYYHKKSNTLDVWFDNPKKEYSCEEIGEGLILKKDIDGNVIGFEKLYIQPTLESALDEPILPVEVVIA